MRFVFLGCLGTLLLTVPLACGDTTKLEDRPPLINSGVSTGSVQGTVEECEEPPNLDSVQSCGNDTVRLFEQKPTIYFVLDVSGSMQDYVLSGGDTKLEAATTALRTVVSEIGHRVKYGMTVFPGDDEKVDLDDLAPDDVPLFGCAAGDEVFPIRIGDPITCLNRDPNGKNLVDFRRTLNSLTATGGTPLSPTLESITPTVLGQEGTTAVVLVTDGSPNCNAKASCEADQCGLNRAGRTHQDIPCDDSYNCCDPALVGEVFKYPGANCVDGDASVERVQFLQENGIDTYVIGVLGNEDFDDVMNRLATAGGQARDGERAYYDVENLSELTDTIRLIGSQLAQNCELELQQRPAFSNQLNVYFDAELVVSDAENGWTLEGNRVSLHGEACELLRKGEVIEVQMISGCETIVR